MSAPSYGARLEIPGTFNLRDLGGYPADGGVVAPGLLLRAEALALPGANEVHAILDEGNREQIRGLGVRTVVDLRTDREREEAPPQWADATGARTVQLAIPEGGAGSDTHVMHELLTGGMPGFSATDMGLPAKVLRSTAELARDFAWESRDASGSTIVREPAGVVLAITPWNFPVAAPQHPRHPGPPPAPPARRP